MADSSLTPKGTLPMPMRRATKAKRAWYTDELMGKAFKRRERRKEARAAAKAAKPTP